MGLVELDQVLVAPDPQRAAGDVMKQIVTEAGANTVQPDARGVRVVNPRQVMDMAVLDEVIARRERLAIAPGHGHSAATQRVKVTGLKHMTAPTPDLGARAGHFPDGATFETDVRATLDTHAVGRTAFPEQAAKPNV